MATASPVELDRLLHRLVRHSRAVIPLADLPEVLELPEEEAAEALTVLHGDGLVELWPDSPSGPATILSAAAACLLGVELLASDRDKPATQVGTRRLRWVEKPKVKPERAKLALFTDVTRHRDGPRSLDLIADPRPLDPAYVPPPWSIRILSNPGMLLLGFGLVGWTPEVEGRTPCPVCGDAYLTRSMICLACTKTGIDPSLPPVKPEEKPRTQHGADLAGGRGKAEGKPLPKPPKRKAGARAPAGWRMQLNAWRKA